MPSALHAWLIPTLRSDAGVCPRCTCRFLRQLTTARLELALPQLDAQLDALAGRTASAAATAAAAAAAASPSTPPPARTCPACLNVLTMPLAAARAFLRRGFEASGYRFRVLRQLGVSTPPLVEFMERSLWLWLRERARGVELEADLLRLLPSPGEVYDLRTSAREFFLLAAQRELGVVVRTDDHVMATVAYAHETSTDAGSTLIELMTSFNIKGVKQWLRQSSRKRRKRASNEVDSVISQMAIDTVLPKCTPAKLAEYGFYPPDEAQLAPAEPAFLTKMKDVSLVGRYNKYARGVFQTPFSFRPGSDSVQGFIAPFITELFDASGVDLQGSGREDGDVRMLGDGRPFVLQVADAKRIPGCEPDQPISFAQGGAPLQAALSECERAINASTDMIRVTGLHLASEGEVAALRHGIEKRSKDYRCIVALSRPIPEQVIKSKLDAAGTLVISQKTPLRVMHRRTLMARPRRIANLATEYINSHFFMLDLSSSPGTYIKEFVSGDRGRTSPSVASLLGCAATIIQLDVMGIGEPLEGDVEEGQGGEV